MAKTQGEYWIVKKSKVHGYGVFARKDIPKGTKIIEYVGKKLTKAQSDKAADRQLEKHANDHKENGAVYIFELNKKYDIDGKVSWNPARYINHSCDENCESDIVKGKIWIKSIKKIKKGEELNYDYGYDYDSFEDHPCKCGSKKCIGYIVSEDHRPKVKKALKKKKSKKKVVKKKKKASKKEEMNVYYTNFINN